MENSHKNTGKDDSEPDSNLTHLSLEEYFEGDWRKCFQDKVTILNILDAAGLSGSHDFVQINSRYLIDDNRIAIIALLKRKNTEILDKLIIDVIASSPTFEQFMDVVYSIGSDCDYRFMLYDVNSKHYSGGIIYCNHLMEELMDHFEGLVSMSLMGVDCFRSKDNVSNIRFNEFKSLATHNQTSHTALPDRRRFEEAEFWGPYAGSYLKGDSPCNHGFVIRDEYYSSYDSGGTSSFWTADGIEVTTEAPAPDELTFNRLIEKHKFELNEAFEGCTFRYEDGAMIIRKDVPFRNFTHSLPADKWKMVDDFFTCERLAMHYVPEVFEEV